MTGVQTCALPISEIAEGLEGQPAAPAPIAQPKPKPTAAPAKEAGEFVSFLPIKTGAKEDKRGKMRYTVQIPDGAYAATYDKSLYDQIMIAKESKFPIKLGIMRDGDFTNIVSVAGAETQAGDAQEPA